MKIRYAIIGKDGRRSNNEDYVKVIRKIISDKKEAEEYGIIILQHYIEEANEVMFAKLRRLLDDEVPLHEIPERMKALNDRPFWLTNFNYENFYYL